MYKTKFFTPLINSSCCPCVKIKKKHSYQFLFPVLEVRKSVIEISLPVGYNISKDGCSWDSKVVTSLHGC